MPIHVGEGRLSILGDRDQRGTVGILGGENRAPTMISMRLGPQIYIPEMRAKDETVPFHAGDTISICAPGGVYGSHAARDRKLINRDLEYGYVVPAASLSRAKPRIL